MRNLKRALSLTLASVMLLGMMVVGSSAAAGYDDVKETDNVEAIEVLQAIEVMVGDERGFGPERPVNRAEMAVVMGKLLSLDYNYYASSCPFNDVYDWARGWVGACAANKIVSGRGDGVYDPGATVTAVEAASMLMRALGYFQYQNDYADGFELSTVRQGTKIGIFDQVGSSATEPMTRNQVAQMVLNALRSSVVEPDGRTVNLTTPDGTVLTGKVNYVSVTSKKDFAHAISWTEATSVGSQNDGWIVELGEKLYNGDLKLEEYDKDDFGRPARTWEYDGKQIGTYVKKELLRQEWTVKVTGKMLYETLSENTIKSYDSNIAIDGTSVYDAGAKDFLNGYFTVENLIRTNTEKIGDTEKGVLTQVFVDPNEGDKGAYYVAVINTYLAKATADYNEKKDEVDFTVYGVDLRNSRKSLVKDTSDTNTTKKYTQPQTEVVTVNGDNFNIKDVKKDDIVLVRVADEEIVEIIAPEVLDKASINAFKLGDYVTTDGTQYDYADTALYEEKALGEYSDKNMKDLTYNIFLDPFGYLIGLEQNEDPDKYLFVTGTNGGENNLKNQDADVSVIFLDGTMDVVKVNVKDSDPIVGGAIVNCWYTYTVNNKGVYTLEKVATSLANKDGTTNDAAQWAQNVTDGGNSVNGTAPSTTYTVDKGHTSLLASSDGTASDRRVYGNDKSVYLNVTTDVDASTKTSYGTANVATGNGINDANFYMTGGSVKQAVIIDDVDAVTVGLRNTSIEVKDIVAGDYDTDSVKYSSNNLAVPKSEIYTLYDDNHYVIAAVVIGEDQGAASKYVYVSSSSPKREEWVSTAAKAGDEGYYIWEREVVQDGKIVTLTEVEDDNYSKIDRKHMTQGEWYKVSFDADGHVRKVTEAKLEAKKYATTVGKVETNFDDNKDTILLVDYRGGANTPWLIQKLEFEGGTLYTNKAANEGFIVDADVNVVYANAKMKQQNKVPTGTFSEVNWLDDVVEAGTGHTALEQALKKIDSDSTSKNITDGKFIGMLAAIIEDGRATSIIINDTLGAELKTGQSLAPSVGDSKFTSNGVTLVIDKSVGAKNFAASIVNGTKLTYAFETDMGATANATYDYDWVLKNADGVVIGQGSETAVTSSASRLANTDIANTMVVTGTTYTLEITNLVPSAYKLTKASNVASIPVANVHVNSDATSIASSSAQTLNLKIDSSALAGIPTDASVTFTVSGIDLTDAGLGLASGVTGSNGTYTITKATKSNLNTGINVLTGVKATGEVKVTVTNVTDASTTVAVNVKLAAGSEKYATLGGTTAYTTPAGPATTIDVSSASVTKKAGGIVTGAEYVIQTAGKADTTPATAITSTDALPNNVAISAAEVGKPIDIIIKVTPTELTLAAAKIAANVANAQPLKFDGTGAIKAGSMVTGLSNSTTYEVTFNGTTKYITTDGSGNLAAAAGDFTVPVQDLLDAKNATLLVNKVYTVRGDGVDGTKYVKDGDTYTLPAKGTFGGTGMKVATAGGSKVHQNYGATITPAGNITLTAGYVKISKAGAQASDCAVAANGETAGDLLVAVGKTITFTNNNAGALNIGAVDSEGNVLLATGSVTAGSTATTTAAGNYDITVTAAS